MMTCKLVILYGIGGLSDVGRHAILAALEHPTVDKITVITEYPELLDEKNWECNCTPEGHTNPFNDPDASSKLEMVKIDTWKKEQPEDLFQHFVGANGVISCLGHRQPGWKYPELKTRGLVAYDGSRQVIKAMVEANVKRVVAISSFGLTHSDKAWPHWASSIMACMFMTCARKAGKDLTKMETAYKESNLDFLLAKPVGIGEDVVPLGRYYLQDGKKKVYEMCRGSCVYTYEVSKGPGPVVGGNMAKMDVARFMVDEAVHPTLIRKEQVVGSKPGTPMSG